MKPTLPALALLAATASAAMAQQSTPMDGAMPGMDHSQPTTNGSMLTASNPADGATLTRAPRTLALTFMHPVMLQTVTVTASDSAPVRATFRRPTAPTAHYGIALPALSGGVYTVQWNATGMGHSMQGTLHFTVQ